MLYPSRFFILILLVLLPGPLRAQNYALRFEGAQLEFPPHPIMNTGDAFTAETWIRAFSPSPDGFKIFDRYAASAEHKYLSVLPTGAVEYIYAGSPWPEVTSPAQLSLLNGNWHHVAFVRRQNGDHAAFLDGVQISGGGPGRCWSTCNVFNASPSSWVGGREASSFPSGWEVDAMRISTVDRYWGNFTPPTSLANDANCAMLLNFNEGAGSIALDEGPARQVGTLAGIYSWSNVNGPPGSYNWIRNPANGHHYALTTPKTWNDAAAEADSLGGQVELVTIRSQAENDWLYSALSIANHPPHGAWLGFSDEAQEGTWVWRSGEPVVFANWAPGEPNNLGDEDYAHMLITTPGMWNDATQAQGALMPAILEWIPPNGPYLARVGICPGSVTLTITGASPSGLLAVLYGRPGSFTKLTPPCSGMVLGLARPELAALIPANSQGSANLSFQAPSGACGRSVQCVDIQSCTTTNIVIL